jgi:hypothetical protein
MRTYAGHLNAACRILWMVALVFVFDPLTTEARAQGSAFGESFPIGSLAGVGNCDALIAGEAPALMCNPAHAVWGGQWSGGGGYRRLYELEYFQHVWAGAKYHRKRWGIGLSLSRFGKEDFYTETRASMAVGWQAARTVAFGIEVDRLALAYTPGAPAYSGISLGLGALYQPADAIIVSGAVGNIAAQDFIPGYAVPRRYRVSVAAKVPGEVFLGASWMKTEGDRDLIGLGQDIRLAKNFSFLSAVYFDPARYALGGKLDLLKQKICYCYLSHPELGATHYIEFEIGG